MATPVNWLSTNQVNTGAAATGTQTRPQIIGLSNGNILVAYEDTGGGTIGSGPDADIIGVIYDAEGNVVRSAFQINDAWQVDDERDFEVAPSSDGGFFMVYMDDNGPESAVRLERFDANGDQTDTLTIASETGTGDFSNPQIVVNNNTVGAPGSEGNRLYVTWEEDDGAGDIDVRGAYVLEDLTLAAGSPFDAAQNSTDQDRDHDSAILTFGELVTVYEEQDGTLTSLEIRILDVNGNTQHSNLFTLPDTAGPGANPQIASLANGNFVVVWNEGNDIFGQIFNNSAGAVGGQFNVATGADNQNEATIVALPDGGFVVAWDDDTDDRFEASAFNADGTTDGFQFTIANLNGTAPDLGVTGDGRILFTGSAGEIQYAIWDPREGTIDSLDYATVPLNFVNASVVTGRQTGTTIQGDGGPDTLLGQGGDDSILGDGGNDSILGRGGDDTIRGGFARDTIEGGTGADSLFGDGGNDLIDGGAANDRLFGGSGDDTLIGGGGDDTLDGGGDSDTVDYSADGPLPPPLISIVSSWDINLTTGTAVFGNTFSPTIQTDTLTSIENVIGSQWGDVITNNGSSNLLQGQGGNDRFVMVTNGGTDTFEGGTGTDTLEADITWIDTVLFDMLAGESLVGGSVLDEFSGIENLILGGGADVIGDGEDNRITVRDTGSNDNNDIDGGGGNDTIDAGIGDDSVTGGSGDDLIIDRLDGGNSTLSGGSGSDDALDLSGSAQGFVLDASGVLTAGATTLNVSSFDILDATDQADDIYEISDIDIINAGGGNDTVRGRAQSADVFDGEGGIDTYIDTGTIARDIDLDAGTVNGLNNLIDFENVIGSTNDDTIMGTDADGNDLQGGDGNDFIGGRGGADTLDGGDGADTLEGSTGDDSLLGGAGADVLQGFGDNDTLNGGADDDRLDGGGGDDVLRGSTGSDTLIGNDGSDTLSAQGGADTLRGGTGIDEVFGGGGDDLMFGGGNTDTLLGGGGADTIIGEDGADSIEGENGADSITGGAGEDTIRGGANNDTIEGGSFNDLIFGGDGSDSLSGDANEDTISGGIGNDTLSGGGGADSLIGGGWSDTLTGEQGNDTLRGGLGFDELDGGSGNDFLLGGADDDMLIGGTGGDTLNGQNNADTLDGGDGADSLIGGNGADSILGGDNNDTISGGDNNDTIFGDNGSDEIFGGNGSDLIYGNQGNDTIIGGAGNDRIFGGIGADEFVYAAGFGDDSIEGFTPGFDTVVMQGFTQGDLTLNTSGGTTTVDVSGQPDSIEFVGVVLTDFSDFTFV